MTQPSWPQQGPPHSPPWGPQPGWGAPGQFQPYGPQAYQPSPGSGARGPQRPRKRGGAVRSFLLAGALVVVIVLAGLVVIGFLLEDDEITIPAPQTPTPTVAGTPRPGPAPSEDATPQPEPSESGTQPTTGPSPFVPTVNPLEPLDPLPTTGPTPGPEPTPTPAPSEPTPAPTPDPEPMPGPSGVGKPDKNPPDLPFPETDAQVKRWTNSSKLYSQKVKLPTKCGVPLIDPATISKADLKKHLTRVAGCLTMVWRPALKAAGFSMPYPVTTVFTGSVTSPCGELSGWNAYYCSGNQRIYFDTKLFEILPQRDYSLDLIMAHEYGHAVQGRTGIFISAIIQANQASKHTKAQEYWRRIELQADCLAGAGMNALAKHTGIDNGHRKGFADIMTAIADDTLTGEISDHGSAKARTRWLKRGLGSADLAVCNTFTAPAKEVR